MHESMDDIPFDWWNQVTRAKNPLKLVVDDTMRLESPLGCTDEYHGDLPNSQLSSLLPPPFCMRYAGVR
jgi:hypothetical protein